MNKQQKWNLWYVFIAVIGVIVIANLLSVGREKIVTIPYSEFLTDLNGGKSPRSAFPASASRANGRKRRRTGSRSSRRTASRLTSRPNSSATT